ncbi:MAG: phosphate ABC transporter substrate-binding protein PstS family protein [Bacteroidetes bacterium]|nr:phosphate ABC transporter substrate-binding protein PstS family protein [Bacteroidota bacterium]
MRYIFCLFFTITTLIFTAGCGSKNQQSTTSITVKGSDTVLPITQKEVEEFTKSNTEAAISVVGGGSGTGITALLDGTTDICMSSRELRIDEKLRFAEKEVDIKKVVIGYDALSVVVNAENPVDKLTQQQIEKIFTGDITNWKEVGGTDLKITVYSRESSSGTYEFFKEEVMDKKNYSPSVLNMPATGAIVQSVGQTKGAIGYIGLAYLTKKIKPLAVSFDGGRSFMLPSIDGARDGSYPITRPLYYLFATKNETKLGAFVDYVLSETGQKNIAETGFVPLK